MPRAVSGPARNKRRKKFLKLAKGFYGRRSKAFKLAKESAVRALSHSFIGRKQRKRQYRSLWIVRINAAVRPYGLSYSKFMNALKNSNIILNRKMIADMAVNDKNGFKELVEKIKK